MLQKTEWKFDTRDLDVSLMNVMITWIEQYMASCDMDKKKGDSLARLLYLMKEYVNGYEEIYAFTGGWPEAVVLEKKHYNEMFRLLKSSFNKLWY
jgi:hypothetical protein